MANLYKEADKKKFLLELKPCIEMGITDTPGSYNSILYDNKPNTVLIQSPIAKRSLGELFTSFGVSNSTISHGLFHGPRKRKAVKHGEFLNVLSSNSEGFTK